MGLFVFSTFVFKFHFNICLSGNLMVNVPLSCQYERGVGVLGAQPHGSNNIFAADKAPGELIP